MDNDHGITDELREWAEGDTLRAGMSLRTARDQVLAIADRIDTAHEHGMEERADRYSELRAKTNNCYIELPKDADGEYIHLGDRLEHINGEFTVNDMTVSIDGLWRAWDGENGYTVLLVTCHHHTPTVEDALREFIDRWIKGSRDEEPDLFAEYAAKLRLVGDDA